MSIIKSLAAAFTSTVTTTVTAIDEAKVAITTSTRYNTPIYTEDGMINTTAIQADMKKMQDYLDYGNGSDMRMQKIETELVNLQSFIVTGQLQAKYKGYTNDALISAYNNGIDNNIGKSELDVLKAMINSNTSNGHKKINAKTAKFNTTANSSLYSAGKLILNTKTQDLNNKANRYAHKIAASAQFEDPTTLLDGTDTYVFSYKQFRSDMKADLTIKARLLVRKGKVDLSLDYKELDMDAVELIEIWLEAGVKNDSVIKC